MIRKLHEQEIPKGRDLQIQIKQIIKDNGFSVQNITKFIDFCYNVAESEPALIGITSNKTSYVYTLVYNVQHIFGISLRNVPVLNYDMSVDMRQDIYGLSKILEMLQDL